MEYSLFNVNNLTNILEENKIESSTSNCYLFLMFFLQRSQLVSNIIKIYNDSIKHTLCYGIKYCILNKNYERIFKKMKEFRAENDKSDLDILIDFDISVDLLELIGLEQELSEVLGIKVDLITLRSVNASLKPYIESDLIRLV